MIDDGTRLQVSLENGCRGPTLPNAFTGVGTPDPMSLLQETPFTFRRPRNLQAAASCTTNRGTPDAPMFQFNHWVTPAESRDRAPGQLRAPARTPRPMHG